MNRRVFQIGLLLLSFTAVAACNKKSSGTSNADKQATQALQAERQKLEEERVRMEAERARNEQERLNVEAERKRLEDERARNVPPIPGTSTPATSTYSCTRTSGSMMQRGATCENYYNFTAADVAQYQTKCTAQQNNTNWPFPNMPNLPNIPGLPFPNGGNNNSAGIWGTAACATNINGARVGGCRSQDSKYVIWYYAPATMQQAQMQCMMQGMTYVN